MTDLISPESPYAKRAYTVAYHDTPVREFHETFGHPVVIDASHIPDIKTRLLRINMIATELVELCRAFDIKLNLDSELNADPDKCVMVQSRGYGFAYDPVEAADALGDLRYLIDGGNLVCGFPGELVLAEIHRSNMSKAGPDGKPIYNEMGKVMKGPNYFKPDIRKVLYGPEQRV